MGNELTEDIVGNSDANSSATSVEAMTAATLAAVAFTDFQTTINSIEEELESRYGTDTGDSSQEEGENDSFETRVQNIVFGMLANDENGAVGILWALIEFISWQHVGDNYI